LAGGQREWLPEILGPNDVAGHAATMIPWRRGRSGNRRQYGRGAGRWASRPVTSRFPSYEWHGVRFIEHADVGPSRRSSGLRRRGGTLLCRSCARERDQGHRWAVGLTGGKANDSRSESEHSLPRRQRRRTRPLPRRRTDAAVANGDRKSLGLRTSTTIADIVRASVEGVICGLLAGVDALERCDVDTNGPNPRGGRRCALDPVSPSAGRSLDA